jgi:hypothetical protein
MEPIYMSLNPVDISSQIKFQKFSIAEDAIIEFIIFNAETTGELMLAKPVTDNIFNKTGPSENQVIETLCIEYVTVISELFCHPRYKPSEKILIAFLTNKYVIDWLFSASIWKTTDAIIKHLDLVKKDKFGLIKLDSNPQKIKLLLALISLGSQYRLPWAILFKADPATALSSYIGLVTQSIPALSEENDKGFNHLLCSAKDLPILDLPVITDLGKLNYGFFNCSYATTPDKYEFKKWLTTMIRHNVQQWLGDDVKNYISNMSEYQILEKPKMAVMLELYSQNHAMFRCFNKIFINLAKQYQLIAFIDEKDLEKANLSVFDGVVTFNDVFNINENAELIANESPDIIFYPSIGMKFWGIYLSQLRLAPIQVMMGGHPSSSYSPEMDFLIILQNSFLIPELQEFMSEQIITGDKSYKDTATHTLLDALTPEFIGQHNVFLQNDDVIKIGINGVLTKVSHDVIDVCKKIQRSTSKKVIFVFFSSNKSNQLAYIAAEKQLSRELKNFDLICFSDYLTYMKAISHCHFLLPTLPFGGSNSNIDAMVLNKPKLYLRGKAQIYTRSDQWEWERVDLDCELGCDSFNELIEKSIHLIEDFTYRERLHHLLVENCTVDRIIGKGNDQENLFSKVFSKIIDQSIKKEIAIIS